MKTSFAGAVHEKGGKRERGKGKGERGKRILCNGAKPLSECREQSSSSASIS
jgi:hypothetical protein